MLACLLGLVPVAGSLWLLNTLGMLLPTDAATQPVWRWLLYMPFYAAHIAAISAMAVILSLARLSRYRPGIIWPVLAALLVTPVWVFYERIGNDELHFALLRRAEAGGWLLPTDALFPEESLAQFRASREAAGLTDTLLRQQVHNDLQDRKQQLLVTCSAFVNRFPDSERASQALWITAQCQSLQVDARALKDGWVRYTACRPLRGAKAIWQDLLEQYGEADPAAVARLKLAELALRQNEPAKAYKLLTAADVMLQRIVPPVADRQAASRPATAFPAPIVYPSEDYYAASLARTTYLLWLMDRNLVLDKPRTAEALTAWTRVDSAEPDAGVRYAQLAAQFAGNELADNLQLAEALHEPSVERRAERLVALAGKATSSDAAIEAAFELGRLLMDTQVAPPTGAAPAEVYLRRVVQAAPNPWHERASQRLARMAAEDRTQP